MGPAAPGIGGGGGHRVVHLEPYFRGVLPHIYNALFRIANNAALAAGWEEAVVDDGKAALGIRCVEHLTYRRGGNLGWHQDKGSSYTLSVLLNDPDGWEGGELYLQGSQDQHAEGSRSHKVERGGDSILSFERRKALVGDAYILNSTWYHQVTPITRGERKVLVLEFWSHPDVSVPARLNAPVVLQVSEAMGNDYIIRKGSMQPVGDVHHAFLTWREAVVYCN